MIPRRKEGETDEQYKQRTSSSTRSTNTNTNTNSNTNSTGVNQGMFNFQQLMQDFYNYKPEAGILLVKCRSRLSKVTSCKA